MVVGAEVSVNRDIDIMLKNQRIAIEMYTI